MMGTYAKNTTVDAAKSRAEIESTLGRYGATGFGFATQDDGETSRAAVNFIAHNRQMRFVLTMPSRKSREFTHTPEKGLARSESAAETAYQQAIRQRWRALLILIKGLLEAVESDIVSFSEAFLPYTVVPGTGQTVMERIGEELDGAIESGGTPQLALGTLH